MPSEFHPMPVQQVIPPIVQVQPVTLVKMSDGDVDQYVVRDVGAVTGSDSWRWSKERPEFRFHLDPKTSYFAKMQFAITEATFKSTGPVTVEYFVNDHSLKKVVYPAVGNYSFEEAVPKQWTTNEITTLAASISPVWVSPEDGVRLGVLLTEVGFVRK